MKLKLKPILFLILLVSILTVLPLQIPEVKANPDTATFYSTASDGNILKSGAEEADYNVVWNAASGTVQNDLNYSTVGQYYAFMDDYYRIWRSFLFFDTSSLPDNIVIQSAILGIYGSEEYANKGFSIVIQNGQPTYPHDPLQSGDYDKDNYTEYGGQSYYFEANFTVSDYNNITMNSDGLSWINKTGATKLCLRSSWDIVGTPPGITFEQVSFWTFEKGEGYRPKLVVTYTPLYDLNLRTKDWNGNIIEGATVYANATTETSDSNGWANFTDYNLNDIVEVKVKYQNVWVNSTTVTMTEDKTINVTCKVYSLTVYVQRSSASDNPNTPIIGASLTLTRTDGYNYTADGLSPATTVAYNSTHAKYAWSQLANQTSSYTVTADATGASNSESAATSLTGDTEVEIELLITGGGPSGSTGGVSPPPPPAYIPPVVLPKVPGAEFEYGILILVGVVGVAVVVGLAKVDKRSSQTKIARGWKRKTRSASNLDGKWRKKMKKRRR